MKLILVSAFFALILIIFSLRSYAEWVHFAQNEPAVAVQGGVSTQSDVAISRSIRDQLSDHTQLSSAAKNVQVLTVNNVTTLRGTVNNQEEHTVVLDIAKGVGGVIKDEIVVR